jgi:hypothetical protein
MVALAGQPPKRREKMRHQEVEKTVRIVEVAEILCNMCDDL